MVQTNPANCSRCGSTDSPRPLPKRFSCKACGQKPFCYACDVSHNTWCKGSEMAQATDFPAALAVSIDRARQESRKPLMSGNQYATEVLRIVSDGTIRIGVWSEHGRDALLKAISSNYTNPGDRIEMVIDEPGTANFRLTQDLTDPHRVRVADYRMSVITRRETGPDVLAVNLKLAAIGRNN